MISFVIICIALISSRGVASDEQETEDAILDIDMCFQNPCQNNATCKDVGGEGKCECIPPYSGEDCSKDPCSTEPCQNDGICGLTKDSYKCTCENGFLGENCEYTIEPSSSTISRDQTVSSSTLSTLLGTTSPITSADTTIETTTTQIDSKITYCYYKPCKNGGTCKEKSKGYECVCSPQYSGDTCEKVVYSCKIPCQNKGVCEKKGDEFKCECVEPYTGIYCEQGPCEPNPCKNDGECTISQNAYICFCAGSYTGKNCTNDLETTLSITTTQTHSTLTSSSTKASIDFCYENPCQNGGTCVTYPEGYKCFCSPLYSGENCDKVSDTKFTSTNSPTVETTFTSTNSSTVEQTTTPGTTHETTMPSTTISTEETKTTSSTTRPTFETTMFTKNKPTQESTTTTTTQGTTRESKSTTTSEETTIDHDLCISSPCLNNGSCISIDNSVRCNCTYPFSGIFCDTDLSEENQSSSNSIVYACTGSVGAIVFVFLIGFSVLWHLKRVTRRKKESYFHNADLSSIESENSRTYII